jgi:hypothetical protein
MATPIQNCQVPVSTIFVFDSPTVQMAANTVYVQAQAFNALPANASRGIKYQFKTDFERMQYLMGLYGRTSQGLR